MISNLIKKIIGFDGEILLDKSKPDGTMLKRLDTTKINDLGWYPKINLEEGIRKTYNWALENNIFKDDD